MTPRTLRRKLQKKKKHKPYRKCPKCGERIEGEVTGSNDGLPHLKFWHSYAKAAKRCDLVMELRWSGGGMADTYPTDADVGGNRGKA